MECINRRVATLLMYHLFIRIEFYIASTKSHEVYSHFIFYFFRFNFTFNLNGGFCVPARSPDRLPDYRVLISWCIWVFCCCGFECMIIFKSCWYKYEFNDNASPHCSTTNWHIYGRIVLFLVWTTQQKHTNTRCETTRWVDKLTREYRL